MFTKPFLMKWIVSAFTLALLASCGGGGGNSTPPNVGGGYTLEVSGGTFNDGSGANGLAVLATLRDAAGNGPKMPWTLSITGPGFGAPLTESYDDGSPSSYMTWWWNGFAPFSGTYTATATYGPTTLICTFYIDATKNLSQPVLNKSGNTIFWNSVTGAGSYYYRVTDGTGTDVMTPGYISAAPLQTTYSFQLPSVMTGSYLVEVYAQTTDRAALQNDISASPTLASQENMSLSSLDFVIGGYTLDARGGVLYQGQYPAGIDNYGLVIWTSILTTTTPTTPPAGDWTITVNGPDIPGSAPITFTYPATYAQYVYWDYGTVPASGTYTVTGVSTGGTTISQTFTIPDPTSQIPVATGLSVTPVSGGGANASWSPVTGANSYYVNVWTCTGSAAPNFACPNGGTYQEIAGNWVNATSAIIPTGTLTPGVAYDVYVTACQQDMTDTTTVPPADPGTQMNMSDTVYSYATFTAQ